MDFEYTDEKYDALLAYYKKTHVRSAYTIIMNALVVAGLIDQRYDELKANGTLKTTSDGKAECFIGSTGAI